MHDSLLELLSDRSVDEISVKELCEKAGVNRSTFYAHYGKVRDVITEMESEITNRVKEICRRENSDPRARLESICEYLYQKKSTELVLFRNHTDTELSSAFEALNAYVLLPGKNSLGEQDEKLMRSFVNFGMFNLIKTWLMEDIVKTPGQIADLLFDRILKAF